MKLSKHFYLRPDVAEIARDLLGKSLFTNTNGVVTGGMIVEAEAYCGATDRARAIRSPPAPGDRRFTSARVPGDRRGVSVRCGH